MQIKTQQVVSTHPYLLPPQVHNIHLIFLYLIQYRHHVYFKLEKGELGPLYYPLSMSQSCHPPPEYVTQLTYTCKKSKRVYQFCSILPDFQKKKKIRNWFLRGESALIYSMPKDVLWDGNSHQRKPINWGRVPQPNWLKSHHFFFHCIIFKTLICCDVLIIISIQRMMYFIKKNSKINLRNSFIYFCLCWVSCGGTDQYCSATGTGALGAADLDMA